MKGIVKEGQLLSQGKGLCRCSHETVRKFGIRVTVSGTISIARMPEKTKPRPQNLIRAREYAAIKEKSKVPPTCKAVTIRELAK
jgi:hypothetical protein